MFCFEAILSRKIYILPRNLILNEFLILAAPKPDTVMKLHFAFHGKVKVAIIKAMLRITVWDTIEVFGSKINNLRK